VCSTTDGPRRGPLRSWRLSQIRSRAISHRRVIGRAFSSEGPL
jgi:hypothetical protein